MVNLASHPILGGQREGAHFHTRIDGWDLCCERNTVAAAPPVKDDPNASPTQNWDKVLPASQRFTVRKDAL